MNKDEVLKWVKRFENEAADHERTANEFLQSEEFRADYGEDFVADKAREYRGKAQSARDLAAHLKGKWLK